MKRKIILTILVIVTVFSVYSICSAEQPNSISVYFNGEIIDFSAYGQEPAIIEGRTLVPLRSIFETLGATVEWDQDTKTVTSKLDVTEISLTIGEKFMLKNDEKIKLDVPAKIINGRTLVPIRAIAEAFSVNVQWNSETRVVVLQSSTLKESFSAVFSVFAIDDDGQAIQTGNGVFINANGVGVVSLNSIVDAKELYVVNGQSKHEITGVLDTNVSLNLAVIQIDYSQNSFVDMNSSVNYELSDEVFIVYSSENNKIETKSSRIVDKLYRNTSDIIVTKLSKSLTDIKHSGSPVFNSTGCFLGTLIIENENHFLVPTNLFNNYNNNNLIKLNNLKYDKNGICIGSNYYDILIEEVNTLGKKTEDNRIFLQIGNYGDYGATYLIKDKDGLSVVFQECDENSYLVEISMTINPSTPYSHLSYFFGTATSKDNDYFYKHIATSYINNNKFSKDYKYRLTDVHVNNHEFTHDIVQDSDILVVQNEIKKYHMILLETFNRYTEVFHDFKITAFGFLPDVLYE